MAIEQVEVDLAASPAESIERRKEWQRHTVVSPLAAGLAPLRWEVPPFLPNQFEGWRLAWVLGQASSGGRDHAKGVTR